ncbi:hypothetical protein C8R43DRAFT_68971 [Mycena crocata]|nr:hypothetical protein C8R43DRAFT_68971 [Mycena crocata]
MSSTDNAALRRRLDEMDTSIFELKLRLKSFEDSREDIQRQSNQAIYPILSLPPEITSYIFLHCLAPIPDDGYDLEARPDLLAAPLLLLQVCSSWRSVAISTPRLWTRLYINLDRSPASL